MDFNRRRFLTKGGLTLGLGGAFAANEARALSLPAAAVQPLSDYERIFAESEYLAALGLPRSWESVRQGFHPFSPDRIAILPGAHPLNNQGVTIHARRMQELLADRPANVSESFWSSDSFRLYVEVSRVLSAYYPGMPLENWLTALVNGEQFYGLLSFFDGVKWLLSLQFKWANTRRVVNPPVDWWLFLLREPLSSETFEGIQPVRLAVGQVYADGLFEQALLRCHVGFLCQEWLRSLHDCEPGFVAHVAALDRVSAARQMNLEVARTLETLAHQPKEPTRHGT